jgi:hypothetical protein
MPRKSLVTRVAIDHAGAAHNCQANPKKHRLKKGDVRLKVRNGRGWDHYCAECAKAIIANDIERLTRLLSMEPSENDNADE